MLSDDPLWYKDAIIYQVHVKAFFDSNDDGIGDFRGFIEKLDYVQDLGVTALWFLPFYPSPMRDDGYDIADYRNVNPTFGTMRDFRNLVREAHRRGLRIITELVINHTSDQHRWFQRARHAKPGSSWRDYYVWSDTDQKYSGTRIIFTDTEKSNWAWDPVAQAYYWHRFFSHQPDLNFDNPRVVRAIIRTMRFWLDMGVDGLRLDAIPYLCEREGTINENLPETHQVIKTLRAALDESHSGRMLLAEANQWPEDVRPYFGEGDECHMAFHFPLMPRIYMALAQEDRHPITDIMYQTPEIPENCQWAIFLRNHDELTLEMVTDRERDYLWNFYAADRRARINVGIRRRLTPLLENDRRKIELLNSLLMSMPGTPIIYYGDEIGMGDNIFLGDRDGVRTPMQWSPDRNGGFSRSDPAQLYLPAVMDPVYGFNAVNVEAQSRSSSSLLNWTRRLIAVRKAHQAFGRGTLMFLYPGNRKVIAYLRRYGDEIILCIANLSRAPQPVELDLSSYNGRVPVELIGRSPFPPIGELSYFITLPAYGFYWFLLAQEAEAPAWHETYTAPLPELRTLVLPEGWRSLVAGAPRETLEQKILPAFLPHQRWFGAKDVSIDAIRLGPHAELRSDGNVGWLLGIYDVVLSDGTSQSYFLPLSNTWESAGEDPLPSLLPYTLARARRGARSGILHDASGDARFVGELLHRMERNETVEAGAGLSLRFSSTRRLAALNDIEEREVQRMAKEQSNTSVAIGTDAVLKIYRRLQPGIHPEIEIGRYLTDVADYRYTPPLFGALEGIDANGLPTALAILQGFVQNQGDGWTYTLNYLDRLLSDIELLPVDEVKPEDRHAMYLSLITRLGVRTAELHRAFALDSGDPAFQPEPVSASDLGSWKSNIDREAVRARDTMVAGLQSLSPDIREQAERLLTNYDSLEARIAALVPDRLDAAKTRYHGDYHLGQVLIVKDDFSIIDFEGEPAKPLEERRRKHSPLKDIAGILRSLDYAASTAILNRSADQSQALQTMSLQIEEWQRLAAEAFLKGYNSTIGDCVSYPADPAVARRLIDLFTLEKALYEICYEAANRPNWLSIPLQGLQRLLEPRTSEGIPET